MGNIVQLLVQQIRKTGLFEKAIEEAKSAGGTPVEGEENVFLFSLENISDFKLKIVERDQGLFDVVILN